MPAARRLFTRSRSMSRPPLLPCQWSLRRLRPRLLPLKAVPHGAGVSRRIPWRKSPRAMTTAYRFPPVIGLWMLYFSYRSMFVLHGDRLVVLMPDGITIAKRIKLHKIPVTYAVKGKGTPYDLALSPHAAAGGIAQQPIRGLLSWRRGDVKRIDLTAAGRGHARRAKVGAILARRTIARLRDRRRPRSLSAARAVAADRRGNSESGWRLGEEITHVRWHVP